MALINPQALFESACLEKNIEKDLRQKFLANELTYDFFHLMLTNETNELISFSSVEAYFKGMNQVRFKNFDGAKILFQRSVEIKGPFSDLASEALENLHKT